MISTARVKWLVSILLAACVLVLALLGGKWGTSYAAENSLALAPHIDRIQPAAVRVGSPDVVMIVTGSGFEINKNPRVRLTTPLTDVVLAAPLQILPNALSQLIPGSYFTEPITYTLTVVQSNPGTVPTIPIDPDYDEVSNPVPFKVYEPLLIYISLVHKN